jgi:hypothetical protein
MKKKPLKKGWYNATIVDARFTTQKRPSPVKYTFCVDSGPDAWQSVVQKIDPKSSMYDDFISGMRYLPYQDPKDALFPVEFIGHRAKIHVDRVIEDNVIKNIILEWDLPVGRPEFDVTKEPSESKYYKEKNGRDLPI